MDIMDEIQISDYLEKFQLSKIHCDIHQLPFEYYSTKDQKFACSKCVENLLQQNLSDQQIVPITSKDVVNDLFQIKRKLMALNEEVNLVLGGVNKNGYNLQKIFNGFTKFTDYFDENQNFKNSLKVCNTKKNLILQSKIKNSKVNIKVDEKVDRLCDVSAIIKTDQDENFIKSMFEKNIELGFLF